MSAVETSHSVEDSWDHVIVLNRRTALLLPLAAFATTAVRAGNRAEDCGGFIARYRTMPTSALNPRTATRLEIEPASNLGLITVLLQNKGDNRALSGNLDLVLSNAEGRMSSLRMREVRDNGHLLYVAIFDYKSGEDLTFALTVNVSGEPPRSFKFV
ncbi:MAG: DUF4426 domain-containing protein, partial [Pseudomonadota bacterium]